MENSRTALAEFVKNETDCEMLAEHVISDFFSDEEYEIICDLVKLDQCRIFSSWDRPGVQDEAKHALLESLLHINQSYPGGVATYVENARQRLSEARSGINPYDGYTPYSPDTVDLSELNSEYEFYEQIGLDHCGEIAVILAAGGLGERLGYNGIKLEIPIDAIECTTYLAHYCDVINALSRRCGKSVPFVIMTSQDTNDQTIELLIKNNYFGLHPEDVHILMQQLVPALADNDAHLALAETYKLALKPHGHGDIHMLMHSSGLAVDLFKKGIRHLVFIQDTNALIFNAVAAAVGVSIDCGFDFNSIVVSRYPNEAVGVLTKLVKGNFNFTINVEYNQLDPLLRSTISPRGDVPNEKGFSIFPGNVNALIVSLPPYLRVLEKTRGIIAEFINPKYADETRSTFRKPARLETMMQDLPKFFENGEHVGVTVFDRRWCFSANKNNIRDAAQKYATGGPPDSAASAESDFYAANRMKIQYVGSHAPNGSTILIYGVPFNTGARVILKPSFALSLEDVRRRLIDVRCDVESTLILDGNILLKDVSLGTHTGLIIHAPEGAQVTVDGIHLKPQDSAEGGQQIFAEAELKDDSIPEYLRIRGYKMTSDGCTIINVPGPGSYTLGADLVLRQVS